ncbi:TPA: hypothetical protein ACHJ73_005307, partial [Escherichia coli]
RSGITKNRPHQSVFLRLYLPSSPDNCSLTPVEYFLLIFTKIRQMGDIEYISWCVVGKNQLMFDSQKQALEVQKVDWPPESPDNQYHSFK